MPVVNPKEFDVAIAYLIRRLEENASSENFMSGIFDLATDESIFKREEDRFMRALNSVTDEVPASKRTQNRLTENEDNVFVPAGRFENTPDTDPALSGNREWGRAILERSKTTKLGIETLKANELTSEADAEKLIKGN